MKIDGRTMADRLRELGKMTWAGTVTGLANLYFSRVGAGFEFCHNCPYHWKERPVGWIDCGSYKRGVTEPTGFTQEHWERMTGILNRYHQFRQYIQDFGQMHYAPASHLN